MVLHLEVVMVKVVWHLEVMVWHLELVKVLHLVKVVWHLEVVMVEVVRVLLCPGARAGARAGARKHQKPVAVMHRRIRVWPKRKACLNKARHLGKIWTLKILTVSTLVIAFCIPTFLAMFLTACI